ncbi:MAG: sigma-70 family RNA polymerase sigma factor [Candidatus Acidiferrum sp.]
MLAISTSAGVNGISNFALEAVSEQHLFLAARDGDQAAYGEICKRNSKKILRITLRITRNYEDAEDALQECFLKAMIHIRDFDGRSQFSTWLTRIAINAALMKIRRKQRYREAAIQTTAEFCEGQELIELTDRSLSPEDIYSEREKMVILRRAVNTLRPRIRSAIEIFHLEDRSLLETSRKLGISQAATKGRLFQAKAVLRKSRALKQLNPASARRAA